MNHEEETLGLVEAAATEDTAPEKDQHSINRAAAAAASEARQDSAEKEQQHDEMITSSHNSSAHGSSANSGTVQRKNANASKELSTITTMVESSVSNNNDPSPSKLKSSHPNLALMGGPNNVAMTPVVTATVKRHKCGTSAFDEHWLNVDCCGLFCATFTYGLHIYGCFAVCWKLLPPWFKVDGEWTTLGLIHVVCFVSIAILACTNHFLAMTTDPGAVPPDAAPLADPEKGIDEMAALTMTPAQLGRRFCRRCNSFKPARAHHCSICKRCVVKMDHHCPWVNNCVGIGNHKFFLLFIFYTFLSCLYSASLLFWRSWFCGVLPRRGRGPCLETTTDFVYLVGLGVEAMLFGLFTSCMMIDQYETVSTNLTQIDRLKGEVHANLPDINEVFGGNGVRGGCRLDWLAPIPVQFPASIRDEIMGFCRPCIKTMNCNSPVTPKKNTSDDIELSNLVSNHGGGDDEIGDFV